MSSLSMGVQKETFSDVNAQHPPLSTFPLFEHATNGSQRVLSATSSSPSSIIFPRLPYRSLSTFDISTLLPLDEPRQVWPKESNQNVQLNRELEHFKIRYENQCHELEHRNQQLDILLGQVHEENQRLKIQLEHEKQQNQIIQVRLRAIPNGIDLDREHLDVCSGTCTGHGEWHATETARGKVHAREWKTRNETATHTHVSRPIRRNQSSRSEPVDHSTTSESIV